MRNLIGVLTLSFVLLFGVVICSGQDECCGDGFLDPGEECDDGNNLRGDGCSSLCVIEDGCTPGYWKNHLDKWPGWNQENSFEAQFGLPEITFDPDITLAEALSMKGGGANRLARHGMAAILNAGHPFIDYPLTQGEVIDIILDAADEINAGNKGAMNALVDILEGYNEFSENCPAQDYTPVPN